MSYLGTALRRVAENNDITQADVARATGMTNAHLSRIFSGVQRFISDPDLVAILNTITKDPEERAEIIAARCTDVKLGPGAELVDIRVTPAKGAKAPKKDKEGMEFGKKVELSADAERAFAWLRSQCPLNPDLEHHLIGYARLTGLK